MIIIFKLLFLHRLFRYKYHIKIRNIELLDQMIKKLLLQINNQTSSNYEFELSKKTMIINQLFDSSYSYHKFNFSQIIFEMLCRSKLRFLFASEAVQSVPGHKPPAMADNAVGRYAGSLFTAASKKQALQTVLQDLNHLRKVISSDRTIQDFLKNTAIKRNQQRQIIGAIVKDNYGYLTVNFVESLIESGRLYELPSIIDKYVAYCKILNKQEDIRVISAKELNQEEKQQVLASVKRNKPDSKFKMTYQVDPTILGGLQIYAGSEFLDCSLRSRLEKLRTELHKIA